MCLCIWINYLAFQAFKHLNLISAGIRIIQIAAHAVIIPVKRQRFCQAAQVAVFGEEGRCYHTVVPCPQILALDIRVVGLPIVGIFVFILRSPESDLTGDTITVGLVDLSLFIGDAGDTSSGIVEVVADAAIIPRTAFPSIFYFTTPTIVYSPFLLPEEFFPTSSHIYIFDYCTEFHYQNNTILHHSCIISG